METRKITVVSTRDQMTKEVNTDATTLGQLKEALNANGISYNGLSFFEGLTRTELMDDDSLLPHDVMYRGEPTNNLVIMLTVANKNIKSGVSRSELYARVKELHLENAIYEEYGKHYTNCNNAELSAVILANTCSCCNENAPENPLKELINVLTEKNILSAEESRYFLKAFDSPVFAGLYTQEEIEDMFDFVRR